MRMCSLLPYVLGETTNSSQIRQIALCTILQGWGQAVHTGEEKGHVDA